MPCEVEYTDEFEQWWDTLNEDEQSSVDAKVALLEQFGTTLGYPHSSKIKNAKYGQIREL